MTNPPEVAANRLVRVLYLLAGLVLLGLGIIGAFLPLMPTTIFLILAAWCFSRSSRRLEAWLLGHRYLGPTIVNWRRHGVIPPRAKILACLGMASGFAIFWLGAQPDVWLLVVVGLCLGACAWFVLSRPSAPRPPK
ncbi:hypothetical protein SAMN05216456_1524 [Devosia crocina]|uniref:Inner membrane protein n=1 Tax=Devosia crocina TaxID=429728 RepID=A0A1I7NBJ4_9HYPH|nr:YbaN family protein [Devosia crocina]SFV32042.1 hypothetical protein SAMN05216456_1524 [Devosia crocina]